jgi:hypothetical protein
MDANQMTALLGTGTGGTILMIVIWLYKSMVGKKLRSKCCEKDIEMGFAVENMTPPGFRNPIHVETK